MVLLFWLILTFGISQKGKKITKILHPLSPFVTFFLILSYYLNQSLQVLFCTFLMKLYREHGLLLCVWSILNQGYAVKPRVVWHSMGLFWTYFHLAAGGFFSFSFYRSELSLFHVNFSAVFYTHWNFSLVFSIFFFLIFKGLISLTPSPSLPKTGIFFEALLGNLCFWNTADSL